MCNEILKTTFKRGPTIMSRSKSILALLLLSAIAFIVPQAQATVTVEVTIAGSSAMWQTMALGAFSLAGTGAGHWTSASNVVNLSDTRVTPNNVDAGTIWIVWNSTATKVWSFVKVDSVVGDRCYFAQPSCTVNATAANLGGAGSGQISSVLWGADSALPATVQSIFTAGTPTTVAATDIRPEDGAFAACRVNSSLGSGIGGSSSDGTDGLGYNPNNAPGVCPAAGLSQSSYVGSPILSGYPGSAAAANVLAFNITGTDPITAKPVPHFSVIEVGAAPIVFVDARANRLAGLTNATDVQLQAAFSGANCDASNFGLAAGGIGVFLREPLSGTMNTTEATVFRKPTVYPNTIIGASQEANVGSNNPLAAQAETCLAGAGARYRGIGTGEAVKWVLNSNKNIGEDGIAYTFFSYGNISSIANNSAYGYITLNGVDPIFASYTGGDSGEPGNGTLPAGANLPASCGSAFPCPENKIWAGGLSFPNVRSGAYGSWSIVRLVSTTGSKALTAANALVTHSQGFVVTSVPDYIPFKKTIAGGITDPGLKFLRSHYQQYDGAGTFLGAAPVNKGTGEAGGDMGGCILKNTLKTTQSVNADFGNPCVTRPTNP
jgi:hypothetical protein